MRRDHTRTTWLGAALLALQLLFAGAASAAPGEDRILAARDAAKNGDRARLEAYAADPGTNVLEPYVQYWLLSNKLVRTDPVPVGEMQAFLERERGSYLAERLRGDWLKRLAKDQDWAGYSNVYAGIENLDPELQCYAIFARLYQGDAGALDAARARWLDWTNPPDACEPVFQALVQSGRVGVDDLWARVRRQVERRQTGPARQTLGWMPAGQGVDPAAAGRALDDPGYFVDHLATNFSADRATRELVLLAFIRLAREDAQVAWSRFTHIEQRLPTQERAFVYGQLAWSAALAHDPQALAWYRAAGEMVLNPEQQAWRVRAALRAGDWRAVREAIEALPEATQSEPVWVYWHGRALAQAEDLDEARFQFLRIADQPNFYGMLAAEELGRRFAPPAGGGNLAEQERRQAETDPGLRRALALFRLDLRLEGVREWNWALRGKDDGFLLAAAEIALKNDIYDRAINTAELADKRSNYGLRYLMPYRELIEPKAREQGLDLSWVYGLMRQESRFVPGARSGSGAQGLMQVMPATGKYVANKLGLRGYATGWLNDPHKNVMLGTNYMRIILESLDNMPVLASAGYNAGPGRAKRWKDGKPLEGAIYAETIPFDETRGYVEKVMANAVVYAAMLEGRAQSLRERLGVVAARSD